MRDLSKKTILAGSLMLILYMLLLTSYSTPSEGSTSLPIIIIINTPTGTPNVVNTYIDINVFRLNTITGLKPPYEYAQNSCEMIAKDVQREHGGDLIFIQPLTDSGAYDLCSTCGHWINLVYKKEISVFYVDYGLGVTFSNETEVGGFYRDLYGHNIQIFDVNKQSPPFGLIHY